MEARVSDDCREGPEGGPAGVCRYEVAIDVSEPVRLVAETLWLKADGGSGPEPERTEFPDPAGAAGANRDRPGEASSRGPAKVVSRGSDPERVTFRAETSARSIRLRIPVDRSALASLPEDEEMVSAAHGLRRMLVAGVRRIVPWGDAMRRPSPPTSSDFYRPDAANLPHVIDAVANGEPGALRGLAVARPRGAPGRRAHHDPSGARRTAIATWWSTIYRNGPEAPSWLVSERTLRFLARTLLAYLPHPDGPYFVEKPENGIHPGNIETLMDSLSSVYDAHVLLATHSPAVARRVRTEQLLCFARDDVSGTDVVTGCAHPRVRDWPDPVDLGLVLKSGVLG